MSEPTAFWCGRCKESFAADEALQDLNEEGALLLCPFCGSESLADEYDVMDEEQLEGL